MKTGKVADSVDGDGETSYDFDNDACTQILDDKPIHSDKMYLANKLRIVFRTTKEEGILNSLMKLISVPLTLLRDYTCPPPEEEVWDRQRASIVPITIVFAAFWLNGNM